MPMPEWYCDECGAANERDAVICRACQQPLHSSDGCGINDQEEQETTFPEASSSASGWLTLHMDLVEGAVTSIEYRSSPPQPPLLHERYLLLEQVGTGGFGAVYKARDMRDRQRVVAIKVIALDTLNASQVIEATDTFNRELSLLAGLDNAHLPGIHEHFIDATHWYLVMDYIVGEPLDIYLSSLDEPVLPLPEVINIGLQLCEVLRYLHQQKPPIIFRDVKPGNIMRAPGGHLYLIDFGIARRFKPGQARDTTPLGSPGFAAPEQYGREQSTVRTDIYGLGATLYYLLTGYDPSYSPFRLPPVEQICPSLPDPLRDLLTAMLSLDPAARPAHIGVVQQALLHAASLFTNVRHGGPLSAANALPARPRRWSALLKEWFSILSIAI